MTGSLSGKFALVTGSSRGIGAASAVRLAREGASVLVHYNSSPDRAAEVVESIRKSGGEAEAIGADLSHQEGASNLIAQLDDSFQGRFAGKLDVLVNCAGIGRFGSLTECSLEDFDELYQVNVRSLFVLSQEAARRMLITGWGRIINIGSCLGERIPMPAIALYSSTKFAVNGLTRGWSRDLGPYGITVNCVQPGPTDTELNPASGPNSGIQRQLTSLGRYGKPEEIADAVAFLAQPSSAFINGENLTVDGGWNA
ncbi:MAG: 3-oxoacyl-ACP reductase family protein [Candidatus Sumerlaeia bacterium]|nr:3-oxoacyl-ACP reductase family protein [Candidatus Sumerlaeia bacterium]